MWQATWQHLTGSADSAECSHRAVRASLTMFGWVFAGLRQPPVWAGRQSVQPLCATHLSRHFCHHQWQEVHCPAICTSEWGHPWPPSQTPNRTSSGCSSQPHWSRPPAIPAALHNPRGCSQRKTWPHWASAQQVRTVFCTIVCHSF